MAKNIDALADYLDEIGDAFEDKVPRLLLEVEDLAGRAAYLSENAAGEFDALSGLDKISAVAKTAQIVSKVPAIVEFMKAAQKELTMEIDGLKEIVTELSQEGTEEQFAKDGKKCLTARVSTPYDCYIIIYGSLGSSTRSGDTQASKKDEPNHPKVEDP
jgi:Mor family transcriptional regulator